MKKGEGKVQQKVLKLLGEKERTTKELAKLTKANRNYIRKCLRELVNAGKLTSSGVASPKGGLVYKKKR